MAGFSLLRDPNTTVFRTVRVASQAYTFGDAVHQDRTSDATDVVPATASSNTQNIYAVAQETVASTATTLLVCLVNPDQEWQVDSTNDAVNNHRYQRMLLTDKATVNNTGTDNTTDEAVVTQLGYTGATTAKKLIVKFNMAAVAA